MEPFCTSIHVDGSTEIKRSCDPKVKDRLILIEGGKKTSPTHKKNSTENKLITNPMKLGFELTTRPWPIERRKSK